MERFPAVAADFAVANNNFLRRYRGGEMVLQVACGSGLVALSEWKLAVLLRRVQGVVWVDPVVERSTDEGVLALEGPLKDPSGLYLCSWNSWIMAGGRWKVLLRNGTKSS